MPWKKTGRRPRRRRAPWRRKKRHFRVSKPALGSGIPNAVIMKHKYCESFTGATTTTLATQIFNLTSMYDPDHTGIGHQPYYYDQMAALYSKYTVIGVAYDIRVNCGSNQILCGVKAQRDTTALSSISDVCERPGAKWALLNGAGTPKRFKGYFSLSRLFGVSKKAIMDDGDYSAAVGASPAKAYYLNISAQHPDGTSSSAYQYTLTLTFYTRWSERTRQQQS